MKYYKYALPLSLLLAIIIIVVASFIAISKIEQHEKEYIGNYLNTILETTHQGFYSWTARNKKSCEIWAHEILPLVEELLKVEATHDALVKSEIQKKLRERLKPFYAAGDYEGFFVINSDNISIASSRDANTGTQNLLVTQGETLSRMWEGETVLTLPMFSDVPLPGNDNHLKDERVTMFVGAPIKNNSGEIIALLTLRINPNDDFAAIFQRAQMGTTGETYCINREGVMISSSRFTQRLIKDGRLKAKQNSILRLKVNEIIKNETRTQSFDSTEEIPMVQSLLAGEPGRNLNGYLNYMGDEVIGAWAWDNEYGFGIVSEINKDEAFAGIHNMRITGMFLTAFIIVLLLGLVILFQLLNRKLFNSERKYRVFFEDSPLGIYQSTSEGMLLNANPTLVQMLGFSSLIELQERMGNKDFSFAGSKEWHGKLDDKTKDEGFVKGLEKNWKTNAGKNIYIRENVRIVKKTDGTIEYYESIVEDITEKKDAEKKIRELNEELEEKVRERTRELETINLSLQNEIDIRKMAEERIRLIFDSSPYSIMLVDSAGTIHVANTMTEEYFGYIGNQLIGKDINMVFPEDKLQVDVILAQSEQRKVGEGDDLVARKKDGKLFPVEVDLTPIEFQGEIMALTNIIDITVRKEAEEKIKKAKQEAEKANQAKSEFLSRMSHEFRTPMNSILGFAQLLDMGELEPKNKKNIRQILKNGKHLLELINEVLDIARIESNRISLSLEAIKIQGVIKEVVDLLEPLASNRQVTIISDEVDLFVVADYQRFKQVILNIVNNAIKYNRPNGSVKIESQLVENNTDENQKIKITITDSGKGIPKESIDKVFEPFERVGAELTEIEGSGLGLSIVKKLMTIMGGAIGVESTLGEGSTFWLELPLAHHPSNQIKHSITTTGNTIVQSQKTGALLYIEDNASNIDLMEQVLNDYRPAVNLITNMYGKNTTQFAKDYKPFLILLDLNLPDIHGSEVVQLLKADPETRNVPIIVVSADAMEKQIKRLMQEGVQGYLTKPIDINQLLGVVDKYLNQ